MYTNNPMKSLTFAALSAAMLVCPIAASAEPLYGNSWGYNQYRVPTIEVPIVTPYQYQDRYQVPVYPDYGQVNIYNNNWDQSPVYYQNSNQYQFRNYRRNDDILRFRYSQELERRRLYDYQRDRRFENRPGVRINFGFQL
jgi:hypothetical protein